MIRFLLGRLIKVSFTGFYCYLGTVFVLSSLGLMDTEGGIPRQIVNHWHALAAVAWFGVGVLFFEEK